MNKKIGTIVFAGILCISLLMVYHQYRVDQSDIIYEDENGVTIRKVEDDTASENGSEEVYDVTKAYYENYDDSGLETYIITGIFNETERYIREVRDAELCEYVFKNNDGMIEMKVSEQQREEWVSAAEKNIQTILSEDVEAEGYTYAFDKDYSVLTTKLSEYGNSTEFMTGLTVLIYNAEIYQIFSGNEEWSVNLIIENMDNGKELVNVQYPEESWNITPEMWDE